MYAQLSLVAHVFGKGAYFASTADLSHPYAVNGAASGTEYTMLLCRLVTGESHLGASHLTAPWYGFDSARNDDGSYMVIFDGDAILPYAIIKYTVELGR